MATKKQKADPNGSIRKRLTHDVADWAGANPQLLVDVVEIVAVRGGALRFGYTTDGGAYSIGIYGDGKPYTEYVRPAEDIDKYLEDLRERWDD